jgi:hypothetical protein
MNIYTDQHPLITSAPTMGTARIAQSRRSPSFHEHDAEQQVRGKQSDAHKQRSGQMGVFASYIPDSRTHTSDADQHSVSSNKPLLSSTSLLNSSEHQPQ